VAFSMTESLLQEPRVTDGLDDHGLATRSMAAPDPVSLAWLDDLRAGGARRDRRVRELHAHLVRVALREVSRRRGLLGGASGPELEDIAHQAATDAVVSIIEHLDDYRGASKFTTWAHRFVINHVSIKMRRHLWSGRRVEFDAYDWEQLPDRLTRAPEAQAVQSAQLAALRRAVGNELTPRQRDVFVAVALNEVPIDVVALRLDSTRGAIYKTLFDARTKLRVSLAEAGYPITDAERRS
jgi:RNA polymerase sigma-70 factor (ECF subfamily)